MLTPNQIKNIQSIKDPLIKQRYIKWSQLPTDLRQMMFSIETADKIHQTGQKNNLDSNQIWWASHTIGMIFLGETKITDFVKTLQDKCTLEESAARQLARDVNQQIFLSAQESLKKVHQISEWPKGQEQPKQEIQKEEPKPEPVNNYQEPVEPKPQLNGNIVDLKGE